MKPKQRPKQKQVRVNNDLAVPLRSQAQMK